VARTEPARLLTNVYPGQFVFDFFNHAQLQDLAQSVGFDPTTARTVSGATTTGVEGKLNFVLEVGANRGRTRAESSTLVGALETATLIEIVVALLRQIRLWSISHDTADDVTRHCRDAAAGYGWAMLAGFWRVGADGRSLHLLRTEASGALEGIVAVDVEIAGTAAEFTGSGRVRLAPNREIRADVLAQTEAWDENAKRLTAIGHAVFARLGDRAFQWHGASVPGGGHGSDF
jgi:hypothetical protein